MSKKYIAAILIIISSLVLAWKVKDVISKNLQRQRIASAKLDQPQQKKVTIARAASAPAVAVTIPLKEKEPVKEAAPVYTSRNFRKEMGFLAGWGRADLKGTKDVYEPVFLIFRYGMSLKPLFAKHNIKKIPAISEFVVEPSICPVINPETNIEAGLSIFLRFAFELTKKLFPYVEAGGGGLYMSQKTQNQSTQFNFNEQAGLGITYFLKQNYSFNVGYRYRHISNLGLGKRNSGINTHGVVAGFSVHF